MKLTMLSYHDIPFSAPTTSLCCGVGCTSDSSSALAASGRSKNVPMDSKEGRVDKPDILLIELPSLTTVVPLFGRLLLDSAMLGRTLFHWPTLLAGYKAGGPLKVNCTRSAVSCCYRLSRWCAASALLTL